MSLHLKTTYLSAPLLIIILQCLLCLVNNLNSTFSLYLSESVLEQALPSFRIIAPQTICKHTGNGSLTSDPQAIAVGFQPRDGIKLSYKVRIFFKITGNRTRTQRNTLLVWKAVRNLENRINVKERLKISQQNMVSINKTEVSETATMLKINELSPEPIVESTDSFQLEPGVVYMFHIIGVTDAGEVSKEKVFTIKYTDGVLERNESVAGLNFLLIGAENTVASIPYLITARVSFCVPRYDFFLRWKMLGLDEEFQDILHTTGSVLKIPHNSLTAGKDYKIQAAVLQSENLVVLAQDLITVTVLKKGFQAYIIPTAIKIGLHKPVSFEVFIQDFDNSCDPLEIFWDCVANNMGKCAVGNNVNATKFEFYFTVPGSYEISATVKLGDIVRSVRAEVIVDPKVYVSYEYSNIPSLVPSAGQALQFSVLIIDLIPNCKAGWSTAQEEGFIYIPPEEIGNGFGTLEVRDLEKEYLSEIVDFGNSTVNKEIILNIPIASENWAGLKGDANYKFRLDTVCPVPYIPNEDDGVERKIVSSFEFVVYTNSPPVAGNIQIKPSNGTALRTVFEVSSESAKDILLDTPLSYEFLIRVEGIDISLGKFYEFKSLDTQLPYSESPIHVMSKVCDIRGACTSKIGPSVRVDSARYTPREVLSMENKIMEAISRTDFNEGQNAILMAALTFKNAPNSQDTLNNFKTFAKDILIKEIDKQYESPTEKYYISKEDIVKFISQTKMNLEILDINDASVLKKLLDLLDLTAEENEEDVSANLETFRRRKRDADEDSIQLQLESRSIIDASYVRMNLHLIEQLLQSYKDQNMQQEKLKIVQKIPALALKMCSSDLITKENINTSVATIDIEKMTGNHLVEKNFTIGNYFTPATGHFQIILPALRSRVKYYCAAFIQFPEDYFESDQQVSYRLQILDLTTSAPVKEIESSSDRFVVELKMPKFEDSQDICLMRSGDIWSPNMCSTKIITRTHVICDCRNFGFYKTGSLQKYSVASSVSPATFGSVSKKPPGMVIPVPNKNLVSSTNKIPTTEALTTTPKIKAQVSPITSTTPLPSAKTKDGKLKQTEGNTSTASTLGFVLPLISVFVVLAIVGGAVFYKRRKRNILSSSLQGLDIMTTLPRESRPGIKYAKFYDEHLMTGNFSNTLPS